MANHYVAPGVKGMLSVFAPWLDDDKVSEIMVNRPGEVFIEKEGAIAKFSIAELTPLYLKRLFNFIAKESQQVLDDAHPMLAANLYDGTRVQLVIPPVASHYTLAIRRKSIKSMQLLDYEQSNFFNNGKPVSLEDDSDNSAILAKLYVDKNWSEFLRQAIKSQKNIVLSGDTSSGKTTFLNALIQEIPQEHRSSP